MIQDGYRELTKAEQAALNALWTGTEELRFMTAAALREWLTARFSGGARASSGPSTRPNLSAARNPRRDSVLRMQAERRTAFVRDIEDMMAARMGIDFEALRNGGGVWRDDFWSSLGGLPGRAGDPSGVFNYGGDRGGLPQSGSWAWEDSLFARSAPRERNRTDVANNEDRIFEVYNHGRSLVIRDVQSGESAEIFRSDGDPDFGTDFADDIAEANAAVKPELDVGLPLLTKHNTYWFGRPGDDISWENDGGVHFPDRGGAGLLNTRDYGEGPVEAARKEADDAYAFWEFAQREAESMEESNQQVPGSVDEGTIKQLHEAADAARQEWLKREEEYQRAKARERSKAKAKVNVAPADAVNVPPAEKLDDPRMRVPMSMIPTEYGELLRREKARRMAMLDGARADRFLIHIAEGLEAETTPAIPPRQDRLSDPIAPGMRDPRADASASGAKLTRPDFVSRPTGEHDVPSVGSVGKRRPAPSVAFRSPVGRFLRSGVPKLGR